MEHIEVLSRMPAETVRRIMLPDTLGLLAPAQVRDMVGRIIKAFPDRHFDFHGHNDYGLGTANTLEAAMAGARRRARDRERHGRARGQRHAR